MAAHTPGEWLLAFGKNGGSDCVYSLNDRGTANRMYIPVTVDPRYSEPGEQEANAHLIAAAPDLLSALKGLMDGDGEVHDKVMAARAAIAKAEGR